MASSNMETSGTGAVADVEMVSHAINEGSATESGDTSTREVARQEGIKVQKSDETLTEKDEQDRYPTTTAPPKMKEKEAGDSDSESGNEKVKGRWYLRLIGRDPKHIPPIPEERTPSPEQTAGFWSRLLFFWIGPIMTVGYKRPLELQDIWLVNNKRSADEMTARFHDRFEHHIEAKSPNPLLKALHDTFKREFWLGGLAQLIASLFIVMSPFTLRYLITFAGEAYYYPKIGRPSPSIGRGMGIVVGILAMQVFQSIGNNHYVYLGMMVGGQVKTVLITAIYEKSLKISGRAKSGGAASHMLTVEDGGKAEDEAKRIAGDVAGDGTGWANGRVFNLMSVHTARVDHAVGTAHMIWTSPVAVLVCLIILVINLSYAALPGFGLLVIGIFIFTIMVKSLFVRRSAINKVSDNRVSFTQEIFQSVRFIKFFGWEKAFLSEINEIRKKEIHAIRVLLGIKDGIVALSLSLPLFASMASFITFSLSKHELNPAKIFSSLALFNSLRTPLNMLPLAVGSCIDAWASLQKIEQYLLAEEIEVQDTTDLDSKYAIEVTNANFTWERVADREETLSAIKSKKHHHHHDKHSSPKTSKPPTLPSSNPSADTIIAEPETPFKIQDINLKAHRSELIAVIGTVGSGKSSLLSALASDMRLTSGTVTFGSPRSFCPQYAWIQSASIRENILFGKPYSSSWYNHVISACALRADFDSLPNGDATVVGERGITLSGGQKQRINIARAIYFDAGVVLLDDPLSAVDAHVGRHIFDEAILGLLGGKCRVLATHQLHVLWRCDRVVWVRDGRIVADGGYEELMRENEEFKALMDGESNEGAQKQADNGEEEGEGKGEVVQKVPTVEEEVPKELEGVLLMQEEERAVRSVPWSLYLAYIRSSGTILSAPLALSLLLLTQGANIMTNLWLSFWTGDKYKHMSIGVYIAIYATLGLVQALLMFGFSVSVTVFGSRASNTLLYAALRRVMNAPVSFFDTTPLGRIMNRFSKDVDDTDWNLTEALRGFFITVSMICGVFILVIVFFHYFAIALVPMALVFVLAAYYYRSSAREIKRHEAVLRSITFAKFGEALSGTVCIRAYGLQDQFITSLKESIDNMNSAYFLTFANARWLSVRLDFIGNALVFTTGVLVVTSRFDIPPSTSGLVLSYMLSVVGLIQFAIRQLAEVENAMNSTERLHFYGSQIEQESTSNPIAVKQEWPEKGDIDFKNVEMRYRPGLPLVLKGIDVQIPGGERLGIVGRTGAGKSSIISTLFRLGELSGGSIEIDGMDISRVDLGVLRERLSIIPQDPTLFSGTIRSNLDPFGKHTDLEMWSALRKADLISEKEEHDEAHVHGGNGRVHLDSVVEDQGLNFSLGQRQLLALARALVRASRIIVCDEATSSVDLETDRKIQRTMTEAFQGKTLICIAHRLRTIIDYDRICVMDQGKIAELDRPLALYDRGGIFRSMCDRSGIARSDFHDAQ